VFLKRYIRAKCKKFVRNKESFLQCGDMQTSEANINCLVEVDRDCGKTQV
jgi:hypothetical protein